MGKDEEEAIEIINQQPTKFDFVFSHLSSGTSEVCFHRNKTILCALNRVRVDLDNPLIYVSSFMGKPSPLLFIYREWGYTLPPPYTHTHTSSFKFRQISTQSNCLYDRKKDESRRGYNESKVSILYIGFIRENTKL